MAQNLMRLIALLSVVAEEWPITDKKWNTKILH